MNEPNRDRMDAGKGLMSLLGKRLFYLDGGMGTMLQAMGLAVGQLPEEWNLLYPERVEAVHTAYLEAGSDIITANTFGATRAHLGEQAEACMTAGVEIAKEAVRKAGRGWVAADLGPLGRLLQPYGDMPFEEAVSQFREAAGAGIRAGAELLLMETMTDLLEVKAAVLGAREAMDQAGRRLPLFCSLTFDEKGRLLTGADIRGTAAMLEGLRVDAIGLNCGQEPKALCGNVRELLAWTRLPVFVSPNASLPVVREGVTIFPTQPEDFGEAMKEMAALGAWGLGGCCGTTPAHIRALIQATQGMKPQQRDRAGRQAVISGRSVSLTLGEKPLLIGERLNPTGKPRMKQALREMDMDYLLREAVCQIEAGADALDVNVGLPEVDEPAVLKAAVEAVQTVCGLPLQLDTADPTALEGALRIYGGKPLINSVCGKQKIMDAVFPLAAKYGGTVVALLLDENGIPESAEGRLAIAARILKEAEKHGIPRTELIFDALTMTVSTNEKAAQITLETVQRLTRELGVYTVLGVSNVSFGLPERPLLTAAFTAMALSRGLCAAILNPLDEVVLALWHGAVAVLGKDAGFADYLRGHESGRLRLGAGGGKERKETPEGDGRMKSPEGGEAHRAPEGGALQKGSERMKSPEGGEAHRTPEGGGGGEAIVRGLARDAAVAAEQLLEKGIAPTAVIETMIMPALALVGERYEKGVLFLPQLLQSAQAAQAAFEVIRARLPEAAPNQGKRVVLATVQGDVHDIGKNIVKVLLQNYGFSVVDLGRDVPPEAILAAVRDLGASVVGLPALMTTTVPAMKETIALLKKEAPHVRVMVGGAVLTADFAERIGADGYGRDAMAAVGLARKWTDG